MRKDEEQEFDRLFWKEKDKVFFTALRYLKKPEDAEEVVQEVFLKVFLSYHQFRKDAAVSTWIYRIALNEIFSRFRKENRKRHVAIEEDLPSSLPLPDELAEWKDMERDIRRIISSMPKKRGKVLFLRFFESLSFKDIAQEMRISEDSAKNLFSLGVKTLKNRKEVMSHG